MSQLQANQSSILSARLNMLQSVLSDLQRKVDTSNETLEEQLKLHDATMQNKIERWEKALKKAKNAIKFNGQNFLERGEKIEHIKSMQLRIQLE